MESSSDGSRITSNLEGWLRHKTAPARSSSVTTRPHGPLTADATEPAWNGHRLTMACPCGVVFERWITPEDADADLIGIVRLN
jgi:hypothetical protein